MFLKYRPFLLVLCVLLAVGGIGTAWAAAENRLSLGAKVMAGVQVRADLIQIANPAYVAMGLGKTHRLEVKLTDLAKKSTLTRGLVGLKIQSPDGRWSKPQQMALQDGLFLSELTLLEKGMYQLVVACRVHDGRKRQFSFNYTVR